MLMPQATIAQSIAIAAMPTFSALIALDKKNEMRNSLAASLRAVLLLSIPAGIGLILLRKPIIALLYQRGQFDVFSTELVAWALLWYALGLVGHSLVEILSRAFYSLHDTKTPVFIGVIAMSLNIFLSYLFSALFIKFGWMPHGGLALANTIATAVEAIGLIVIMRNRIGGLNERYILKGVLKTLAATIGMIFVLIAWLNWASLSSVLVIALGGIFIGGFVFGIIALLLRLEESILVFRYGYNRLSNKFSK